jgi:hypothetical protein
MGNISLRKNTDQADFVLKVAVRTVAYIEKIVFLEKNASKKREITQIKCWIELSSLKIN